MLLERVLDEILLVVKKKGILLPERDIRAIVLDHCWQRYNKPSMLQHVERGRHTEIEVLNGARTASVLVKAHVNRLPTRVTVVFAANRASGRRASASHPGRRIQFETDEPDDDAV